ncbi:hypothetical protein SAMN02787144_101129 [Streptomyces atratus]|uniref:Integral membrane protein n=1 Tax=Streptomyces atratus TaxID=1893 RepID=A0A1K2CJF3_STRAR|nr:hypothetical protein SAMN02787144_101129 [Streptomyces atratus]
MVRRPVAFVTALVLFAEAVGIVLINGILATVVKNQDMSLAGMDPAVMANGTWAMGGVFGLYLLLCGLLLLLAGIRDRAPGRFARIVLILCAVVHGVLGALTVGLVGWTAFAILMVVLGLIVLTLVAYGTRSDEPAGEPAAGAGASAPAPV